MKKRWVAVLCVASLMAAGNVFATDLQDVEGTAKGWAGNAVQQGANGLLSQLNNNNDSIIQMGKLAEQKAASGLVKNYAKNLVTEHLQAGKNILAAAKNQGVSLASAATPASGSVLDRLKNLSGRSFEKAFLEQSIESHLKGLASIKAATAAPSSGVQNLAERLLPKFQSGLDEARSLQKTLGFAGA